MKTKPLSHNNRTRHQESKTISNSNIFQNEKDYKMKSNLSFAENEEINCQKAIFMRHINIIYIFSIYLCYRYVTDFYTLRHYGILFTLIRIPLFMIGLCCHLFVLRINRFISNIFSIRILFEVCLIYGIISDCYIDFNFRENDFWSMDIFFSIFALSVVLNYCFSLDIKTSIIFYFLESFTLLSFHGHQQNFFLIRLSKNIFSNKILILGFYAAIAIWFQYMNTKSLRELWALYDSFKRSYFSLKSILEDVQIPLIVVKKDLSIIYFKNKETDKMFYRLKGVSAHDEISFIEFFNLTHPKILKLFKNELEKAKMNYCQTFIFPFAKKFQFKESPIFPTLYKINPITPGNANAKFLQFYCSDYLWKNEIEVYYFSISENPLNFTKELLHIDNLQIINEETSKFVLNLNHICQNAPDFSSLPKTDSTKSFNNMILKTERTSPYINNPRSKLPIPRKSIMSQTTFLYHRNLDKKNFYSSPLYSQSTSIYNKILNELQVSKKNHMCSYHSFIFYIKFNLNYLSDLFLTNYMFKAMVYNKVKETHRFNFNSFLHYMINYLSPISKIHNFQIIIKNDLNEEIEANYYCIRTLIFNILMFIFNNSKDMKEKVLEIRVEHVLFGKQNGCYYRLSFTFNEANSYYSYETLGEFFTTFDLSKFSNIDLNKLNDIIDFGLLVSSLIANTVFVLEDDTPKSFVISSNPQKISVIIFVLEKSDCEKNSSIKHFKNFDTNCWEIEKKALEMFASIHYKSLIEEKKKAALLAKSCLNDNDKYDHCKNDQFLISEECAISLEKDMTFAHDYKMKSLSSAGDIQNKSYFPGNIIINDINKLNSKLNFIQRQKSMGSFQKISIGEYTYTYCKIPKFLIVEDNYVGRLGVVEKLREIGFKFLFDIATDKETAIERFKAMFNRGYMFDFIFMDIVLINSCGIDATRTIRQIERTKNIHTNIICISVNAKSIYETQSVCAEETNGNLFDSYCKFLNYILLYS